jgi:uncharacterized protein (DUF1810 family)
MEDRFNLTRFVSAQAPVYEQVVEELRDGHKRTHWIWFIFPQVRGLGRSPQANHFGIGSLSEARAYWSHQLLGARLAECTQLVNQVEGRSIYEIFGTPDDLKFRSSMTLFARAAGSPIFGDALQKYFEGELDPMTVKLLGQDSPHSMA